MKWITEAGPRQTKAVQDAIEKLNWEGKTRIEKTGVIGGQERESVITGMCSEPRPEASAAILAIHALYGGRITAANAALIVADLLKATDTLKATRPIDDLRRTPAEKATERTAVEIMEAERAIKAQQKKEAVARRVAELQVRYPWAKLDGSAHARAAFNCKKELSLKYPGVDFKAKSESYSMGNSVNVHWTMGPTTAEVKKISDKYQAGNFDGMTDCYDYDNSVESAAVSVVLGQSKYVFENRHFPEGVYEQIGRDLCTLQRREYVGTRTRGLLGEHDSFDLQQHVWQLLEKTSWPAGMEYSGLRYATREEQAQDGRRWVAVEFKALAGKVEQKAA